MTLLLALALSAAPPPALAQAEAAYRAGQLDRCQTLLDGLLLPGGTVAPDDLGHALVLRAAVAFARGNAPAAREDLVRAHGGASPVSLSAALFPPDFRDFDLRVRREEADRIARLRARTEAAGPPAGPPRRAEAPQPALALAAPPPADSALWALAPLGVPQRRRGAAAWGDVLAATQLGALAVGLGSLAADLAMRNGQGLYTPAQAPLARGLNVSYLAGCYGALALYAVGIVDALAFGHGPADR